MDRYQALYDKTKAEFPRFNVRVRSQSWLWLPFAILRKITRRSYSSFNTTIFSTMYVGDDWDERTPDEKYRSLRHEKKHVEQFHCFPLGRWAWPINHLLMAICYLLILPAFFTFRAKFEREGYTQTLLVYYELGGPFDEEEMESLARWMVRTFAGSTYFWMWRKKATYKWAMETMRAINAGEITNLSDRIERAPSVSLH